MATYVGLNEDALRSLLSNCTDFSERRRIRAAIRSLVQYGTSDTTAFDYGAGSYKYGSGVDKDSHRRLEEQIRNARDEDDLNNLLSLATDYQDRRKIRNAIRDMRRKKLDEEDGYYNNHNSIRTTHQPRTMASPVIKRKELNLDGITDESVLQQMLDVTTDFDHRMQIRAAMRELWKRQQEAREFQKEQKLRAALHAYDAPPEGHRLEARLKKLSEDFKGEAEKDEAVEGEKMVNVMAIRSPEVLERMLLKSNDFGERSQIRARIKDLRERGDDDAPPALSMIKTRRLSEGLTDVIWLDNIDRVHPQDSSREELEHVEEEAQQDCVSYEDITDVHELDELLDKARDIGEKRLIRSAIARKKEEELAKLKKEEEEKRKIEEAAKRKVEEAAKRKAEEEAARRKAEEEAIKRKEEEEAAKRKAEEEAAKRKAEEEAAKSGKKETGGSEKIKASTSTKSAPTGKDEASMKKTAAAETNKGKSSSKQVG